jgi:hypothetical protein
VGFKKTEKTEKTGSGIQSSLLHYAEKAVMLLSSYSTVGNRYKYAEL